MRGYLVSDPPYKRTDNHFPLPVCDPSYCTTSTGVLEKAIAEQLFGDDMWGPWADCTRTGSYEFEGIGEGHFILIH